MPRRRSIGSRAGAPLLAPLVLLALRVASATPVSAAPVRGQEPQPDPSPPRDVIVVTASQAPIDLAQVGASVAVITGEEIAAGHFTQLADVLRQVPGLHVEQPGARGSRTSLYLRGTDPSLTLVLIDGIRMNDPTNNRGGSFDLSTLDVDDVERIEVVRGPLSGVHGSDAIGGVVNILTKRGRGGDALELDVSGGRFGYYRTAASLRGQRGIADLAVAGSWVDEGHPEFPSEYRGGHFHGKLGLALPDGSEFVAVARYLEARMRAFPDDSGGPLYAVLPDLETRVPRELSTGLRWSRLLGDRTDVVARASYYQRDEDLSSPGIAPGPRNPFGIPASQGSTRLDRSELDARVTHRSDDIGLEGTLGGGLYWEKGRNDIVLALPFPVAQPPFELDRLVGGPYAELRWDAGWGVTALASVRIDLPDDADDEITPRVSGSWALPWLPVTLHGSWGEGFKLPSFYSLGDPIVGNPDLLPERSRGWDLGVGVVLWEERLRGEVTYFDQEIENLIDFDPAVGAFGRIVNRDEALSRGVEASLTWQVFERLGVGGQLTYNPTELVDDPADLLNRPRLRGDVWLRWEPLDVLDFELRALFVGSVKDSSVPTEEVTLDPYQRLDLSLSYRPTRTLSLYLAIQNLLDQEYQEAVGFPTVSIRPIAGVRIGLGEGAWP